MPGFELVDVQNGFDVYKNNNFVGYGFSYDYYMDAKYCENLSGSSRADHMLTAILLDAAQIEKYGYMFKSIYDYNKEGGAAPTTYAAISAAAEKLNATSATEFEIGKNSFSATVQRAKETLVFFSIPYDSGWSATVNGKPVTIEKVNVGFMAVPVSEGESKIVFTYKTSGINLGIIVSVSALALFVVYLAAAYIFNKKHPIKVTYPEGEELISTFERYETEEMLKELPSEIEISEE